MTDCLQNTAFPPVKIIDQFPDPKKHDYNEKNWYDQHGRSIVIINCQASNIEYPEHWTPLSIKSAFGGREYYHFSTHTVAVSSGNFLILNEGTTYKSSIHTEQPTESFTINFTTENIQDVYSCFDSKADLLDDPDFIRSKDLHFVEKLHAHGSVITCQLIQMRKLVQEKNRDSQLYFEIAYTLLGDMIRLHSQVHSEIDCLRAKKRSSREELYKRLYRARDFMESCYQEEISLTRLSGICFLNPYYLLRTFKENFNITPHQYLTQIRLREAGQLVKHSGMKVNEIAKAVGFEDQCSFGKLFKKHLGSSPENYRRSNG